jgi:glycosyltransferase involved in cell wall biosynthesis
VQVTVIIPTYNRAQFIADAIRSVQAQTVTDVEIIVADDGSTDNTAEIVSGFGPSVTYLCLQHRGQPAASRNSGLRYARGEFVAFLDSDDLYFPHKLALQMAAFDAHPGVGLVYSDACFFHHDPARPIGHRLDGLPKPTGNVFPTLLTCNFLSTTTVLIRRSCLDVVGEFDENPEFIAVEDYDFWLRIAAKFPIVFAPGAVGAIRHHNQNISLRVAMNWRTLQVRLHMETLYPDLMRLYSSARHEAYARSHWAVAFTELQNRRWLAGLTHIVQLLAHLLQTPGLGIHVIADWCKRRLRQCIAFWELRLGVTKLSERIL